MVKIILACVEVLLFFLDREIGRRKRLSRHKQEIKEKYGVIREAEVVSWNCLIGSPTFYMMKVSFEDGAERRYKKIITCGKFAKKYERIRTVRVAVIPGTEDVFLEEEDGKAWNLFYLLLQVVARTAFVMYMILLICGK